MKTVILLALLAFVAADEEQYNLEKIDISKIGEHIEPFKNFLDCLLDRAPCSEVHQSYKVRVSESFQTACGKCTPDLKKFASQFFDALKSYFPEDYDGFIKKYDPENKYTEILFNEINKYNV